LYDNVRVLGIKSSRQLCESNGIEADECERFFSVRELPHCSDNNIDASISCLATPALLIMPLLLLQVLLFKDGCLTIFGD